MLFFLIFLHRHFQQKRMREILYIFLLLMVPLGSWAQDYSFSQYFLDKLSVSPAFVSVGDYSEVGACIRSQWPGVDGGYRVYMAEYQQKLPGISSGLGLRAYGNMEGGGAYSSTSASLLYGYDFSIIYNIKCSLGMEAGYSGRSLNRGKLVYLGMIDPGTGAVSPLNDYSGMESHSGFYLSAGAVIYTKYTLLGVGLGRLAEVRSPSLPDGNDMSINVMVNHKIVITGDPDKEKQFLVPCISYSHSRMGDMLMPGVYYSGLRLLLSAAYRMFLSGPGGRSSAVVTSVGFDFGRLELGIGHDFETSRVMRNTHGATEVGLKYKF